MFCWHKWSMWRQYEHKVPAIKISENWRLYSAIEVGKERVCKKCGEIQVELIKYVISLIRREYEL